MIAIGAIVAISPRIVASVEAQASFTVVVALAHSDTVVDAALVCSAIISLAGRNERFPALLIALWVFSTPATDADDEGRLVALPPIL